MGRDAWRLVHGLLTSTRTIMSTLALLLLMLYIFACIGLEVITKDDLLRLEIDDFEESFGSLFRTMLTLLQFVTLDSMASIYLPLIRVNPYLIFYFLPIIVIVSIALMNLVTATLVEGALAQADADSESKEQEMMSRVKKLIPMFHQLFDRIDGNGDGIIHVGELHSFDWDLRKQERSAFEYFEFDSMLELFEILDADASGELDKEEFVEGLINLSLAKSYGVPREQFMMMKLMRMSKLKFSLIEKLIADLGSARAQTPGRQPMPCAQLGRQVRV